MSETKFTPGPWASYDVDCPEQIFAGDGGMLIATCTVPDDFPCQDEEGSQYDLDTECVANTYLIAAAPDLYAALALMVHKAEKQNWNDKYPDELEQAEGALAKARGEARQ